MFVPMDFLFFGAKSIECIYRKSGARHNCSPNLFCILSMRMTFCRVFATLDGGIPVGELEELGKMFPQHNVFAEKMSYIFSHVEQS